MDDRSGSAPPLHAVAIAVVLLVGVGCHTWKPVPPAPLHGATVRVTYAAPRDVMATDNAGDIVRIAGVRHWDGTVVRAGPDTLHVHMTSASMPAGSVPARTLTVAVVREPGVAVARRSIHVVKTILALWFAAGIVAAFMSPNDTEFLPGF